MSERKIPKKEIAKEAEILLKYGNSKQRTFELLVGKFKYSKDIVDILKNMPSRRRMKKYGAWNTVLLILLILIELAFIFSAPSFIMLYYGLLIYVVAKKMIKYYSWITFLSTLILFIFIIMFLISDEDFDLLPIFLTAILGIPSAVLPIWLEKKLCPKPIERKVAYTNAEGEAHMKISYEFKSN